MKALKKLALPFVPPRWLLKRHYGVTGPHGVPDAPWANGVLQTQSQVEASLAQVHALGLPPASHVTKNWDALAALELILKNTKRSARIFDAGGERYSVILPWLGLYGYRKLIAGNTVFTAREKVGPIVYEHVDITQTRYPSESFDAVTCLSVIEHGVDLKRYFSEMARIIAPGGLLITSTDYWETPVDTRDQSAYGVPIHIFTRLEIEAALQLAQEAGFTALQEPDLKVTDRVVHWEKPDLRYTYAIISLRKE